MFPLNSEHLNRSDMVLVLVQHTAKKDGPIVKIWTNRDLHEHPLRAKKSNFDNDACPKDYPLHRISDGEALVFPLSVTVRKLVGMTYSITIK